MVMQSIERVDEIPIIIHWLNKMRIAEMIDAVWLVHGSWRGLTYGQLAVLFITYVVHSLNHRLSGMEGWVLKHKNLLEQVTGWTIGKKDATDDRLGAMVEALGSDDEKISQYQRESGKHLIQAFELPTKLARYDTTSFNVHHNQDKNEGKLLELGYSKDNRPDLLQFKQGLGVLDPAGVPLYSNTFAGNDADDPKYIPAWREMAQTIGHKDFLYVADSKAAALETRGTIDKNGGKYLFPQPMTGNVPEELKKSVASSSATAEAIYLEEKIDLEELPSDSECDKKIGRGFAVEIETECESEGEEHIWTERRLVIQSDAHAQRQKKALTSRLEKVENSLEKMKPKKDENGVQFKERANKILEKHSLKDCFEVKVIETISQKKCYTKKGRPGPNTPYKIEKIRHLHLDFHRIEAVIEEQYELAGWRIYVSNTTTEEVSVPQSVRYYREEWRVERGMHRFKKGSLPALPLFLRIEERIKGLMMLLTIALQVLTLLEFVIRRELESKQETMAGLVPGNPRMKTARPTAERLLAQFKEINGLIEETGERISVRIVETLTPLQVRILRLLGIPPEIYELSF